MIERYVPKFSHKDWIDHQDRVQAGGKDGLNSRFHRLEEEFAGLADNQINRILDVLGAPTRHLTLVPALIRYTDAEAEVPPWAQSVDSVEKPDGETEAHGVMNVLLPDGVFVRSLLVTGDNQSSTGTLTVTLKSRKIDNTGGGAKALITSTALDIPAVPSTEVKIQNDANRYFLTVDVERAEASETVSVFCVQLVYQ
ncbi:hypothetical protein [Streptomyces sp. NPDC058486]|uniref:hypothetical protein n=1 Tax=unclassified Streptomyces TaxID=2593676 RepID=UPI003648F0A0